MWPYWLIFLIPAAAALGGRWLSPQTRPGWLALIAVLTLFIGYRHQVGGDWRSYIQAFEGQYRLSLYEVLSGGDPGYYLLNWLVIKSGGTIYTVNLICGLICAIGLAVFSRTQPRPWLAVAVAIPYLVHVVMMGYTRQSVAISLGMLGLAALARARQRQFMFYALAAATFHKSAVALVPLAVLQRDRNLWITVLGVCALGVIAYWLLLHDHVNLVLKGYIEVEYKSAGALVRLVMNALPAAILLAWRSRFGLSDHEWKIWRGVAVTAIILVLLYPGFPSSVILDRLGLYLIPLQLFVYSRLPDVIGKTRKSKQAWVAIILCYCALVQFVWLNFSMNAHKWIPYQFYPFAQP